jgi:hypothetical protein
MKVLTSVINGSDGVLLIILPLFFLIGCHKCVQNNVADLRFTPEELNINPYSHQDTLVFRNEVQDSIVYLFSSREIHTSKYFEIGSEEAKLYHNDCMGDFYETEQDLTVFRQPLDSVYGMAISLSFLYSFENPTYNKEFYLQIIGGAYNAGTFIYNFEKDTILKSYSSQPLKFYSVIQIGPKIYSNVYEFICDTTQQYQIQKAYYSITEGVIGFEPKDGPIFYLVN